MKKILLILSAIFVSTLTYSGVDDWTHLNPFAYDLKSEVIENGTQLKLTYSLNATAVTSDTYNEDHHGLQIYLIDENGNRIKKEDGTTWACTSGSYQKGKDHSVIIPIADLPPATKDKLVSWEVVVHGNKYRTLPKVVDNIKSYNSTYYPRAAHGIAVEKNPANKYFGRIFIAEACTTTTGKNSLLEYDMLLKYKTYHHKDKLNGATSHFSSTTNYEPHRVKISDDGRVFATCYHTTASDAVVEYLGNGEWNTIVSCGSSWYSYANATKTNLNRRIVDMDVKGSGDNLKIIATWITPKNNQNASSQWLAKVEVREYEVGKNKTFEPGGGEVVAEFNDVVDNGNGLLYQAYNGATPWNAAQHGFIGIAYDKSNDNIWMRVDFAAGQNDNRRSQILYFDRINSKTYKHTFASSDPFIDSSRDGYYGGNAFFVNGDILVTGCGTGHLVRFTGVNDFISGKTNALGSYTKFTTDAITGRWTNAIAEDYAGNLYVLTEDKDNVFVVAMPYDGTRITRASAEQSFTVSDPIPNILATDLRFAPDGNSDRYVFSFNVNTTPQVAQIRFYKSYGDNGENDMKKNLAKINADDYPGEDSITPSFVYDIPTNQLKQGKISVSLGMCGGTIEDGKITNGKLPRGEWYWSVYVEAPRKSSVFAPIYRLVGQTHATEGYERKHATVNNYPETDGFGNIIVAHNPQNTTNDATRPEKGLRIYGISDSGNDEHAYTNTDRYSLRATYLNKNSTTGMLNYPRRMDVASDGKVYIADEGSPTNDKDWKDVSNGPVKHVRGGVKVWDPAIPNNFSLFSDNKIFTATSVALWDGKLYATNTYDEYVKHLNGKTNYTKEQQANTSQYGWNGFVGYVLNKYKSPGDWNSWSGNKTDYALGRGDAAGNIAIVAMDKGVWMCQHKEHNRAVKDATYQPLADNLDGYILSFVPYGSNTRTWRSCVENGVDNYDTPGSRTERADASDFSQKKTSPVQSTPGGGIAYKKVNGKEYLYVVNHDGNIAQLEITSWSGSGTTATPTIPIENIKILTTPAATKSTKTITQDSYTTQWTGAYITSMTFDYAGNLVTTTGKNYHDGPQDIVVYTMPYDRKNAREIQAPNSCRYIPERVSHLNMGDEELSSIISENQGDICHVDIFRPMFNTSFSTICLPFDVDLSQASANEYKDAKLMKFAEAVITDINKEKMLELRFTEITDGKLEAGIPYLIQPQEPITQIVHLAQLVSFKSITPEDQKLNFTDGDQNNSITFKGIIPYQQIEVDPNKPWPLILVDNNRLAEVSTTGYINGFRAYFQLEKELTPGTKVGISARKPTPTNVITIDGKRVNIEKFLREGRVYIRVGDSLYTISGEKVE